MLCPPFPTSTVLLFRVTNKEQKRRHQLFVVPGKAINRWSEFLTSGTAWLLRRLCLCPPFSTSTLFLFYVSCQQFPSAHVCMSVRSRCMTLNVAAAAVVAVFFFLFNGRARRFIFLFAKWRRLHRHPGGRRGPIFSRELMGSYSFSFSWNAFLQFASLR